MDNSEFWNKWEASERLKMKMLKTILIEQRTATIFATELWSRFYQKPFPEAQARFEEMRSMVKGQFQDYLFAEFGEIDPKEIFPEDR